MPSKEKLHAVAMIVVVIAAISFFQQKVKPIPLIGGYLPR